MTGSFISPHGGYHTLLSYQKAQIVYDATVYFCNRFYLKPDRTIDRMVQAARLGMQNIVEGSQAPGASKETEIRLTSVARASLEELLEDYRDFLRGQGLQEWPQGHPYTKRMRELNGQPGADYETFRKGIEHADPEVSANVVIWLVKVTTFLLDTQLQQLEQTYLKDGGLRERMYNARLAEHSKPKNGI
ncbi:conserved hypothetical protein [Chlorobium limicola DSM 245]|uniref:Four helix bundle protein n=1 Tax=Chlorobium limicola (strain DSM 245 / NBRC 103803 / 6330) TaxID=290315 RepID=B3EHY6_CHLL2|nr:four helix bundle suffix domain-containing protein [Chlorobium limicola]ACD91395.1 conserved hypothetical protein [Chlorobium limicola DSM 245]